MLELVPDIWTIAACVKQLNCLNHGGVDSDEEGGNPIEHQEEVESLVESQEETDPSEYQEDGAVESQDERSLLEAERDGPMCEQQHDDHANVCGVIMLAILSICISADLQFRNEKDKERYQFVNLTRNECVMLSSLFVITLLIVSMTYRLMNKAVQKLYVQAKPSISSHRLRPGH